MAERKATAVIMAIQYSTKQNTVSQGQKREWQVLGAMGECAASLTP